MLNIFILEDDYLQQTRLENVIKQSVATNNLKLQASRDLWEAPPITRDYFRKRKPSAIFPGYRD